MRKRVTSMCFIERFREKESRYRENLSELGDGVSLMITLYIEKNFGEYYLKFSMVVGNLALRERVDKFILSIRVVTRIYFVSWFFQEAFFNIFNY